MQIREHAENHPDKAAVILYPSGTELSFAELEARANRLAHYFRMAGLREGDTVAAVLENNEHIHAVMWAARRAGLYYALINTHLTPAEAAYIVDNSGAKALIGSRAMRAVCEGLPEHLPRGLPQLLLMADDDLAGWQLRSVWPINRPRRSPTNVRATCCSTRRAPPGAPRASVASCCTSHLPRRRTC